MGPGHTYGVEEANQDEWSSRTPTSHDFGTASSGSHYTYTFINTQYGYIIVDKITNPSGQSQSFAFNLSGTGVNQNFNLTDAATPHNSGKILPGTYAVSETVPGGWDNVEATCNDQSDPSSVSLQAGETVICTFTNTHRGHIVVVKDVIANPDPQDFTFHNNFGNGNDATFLLDEDSNATLPSSRDFEVLPGTYEVTEDSVPGWQQESATCDSGETIDSIDVAAGETVTCTFVNEEYAKITLVKNTIGGNDSFDFDATGAGLPVDIDLTTVGGTVSQTFDDLDQDNTYSIAENVPAGWDLTNSTCTGTNTPASITPDAGETVTCTFTNTQRGRVIVHNFEDQNADGVLDAGENPPNVVDWPSTLFSGSDCAGSFIADGKSNVPDGNATYGNLVPGNYSVRELAINAAWTMTTPTCQNVTVTAGQDSTLNFGKFDLGSITGFKYNDSNGNEQFDGSETKLSDWQIFIDGNDNGTYDSGELTTTTDASGNYSFYNQFTVGTYKVCEVLKDSNWIQTQPSGCHSFTIDHSAQIISGLDFGNFELGKIKACKYEDVNGNGTKDAEDLPLAGVDIQLFSYPDDWEWEETKATGQDGCVIFDGLTVGQYKAQEIVPAGYYQTKPMDPGTGKPTHYPFTINSGSDYTDPALIFLNSPYRTISGQKFNDLNGNGTKDAGEPGLPGWTIFIDYNNNGVQDDGGPSAITDANGNYQITGLVSDSYTVAEVLQNGWTQTYPVGGSHSVELHDAYKAERIDFGNVQLTDIYGFKWNDLNGNGERDCIEENGNGELETDQICELEPLLSGWTIFIDENGNEALDAGEPNMPTDDEAHFGWYWFENLIPGTYSICEIEKTGWNQTYPGSEAPQCHTIQLPSDCNEFAESSLVARVSTPNAVQTFCEFHFGNQFIPPILTIEKFNDQWPVTQVQGAVIDYTITVRAEDNNVNGVVVKDLLPEGFSFQSITSVEKNGNPLAVANPAYASPGTWGLGDLIDNDVVVIKFKAQIGGSQDPGTYKDLAWAEGTDDNQGEVLATSVAAPTPDDGVITNNFVGTQIALAVPTSIVVELNEDRETDTDTRTRRVLGAALPATGASNIWISIVALLATIGAGLMLIGRRKQILANSYVKTVMKVFMLSVLGLVLVGLSPTASATTDTHISVRIEDPKSPSLTNSFKIGFVTLDIDGRNLDAECYKVGSPDVLIPIEYTPALGGNSGDCVVNSTVAPTDGTYQFYVKAITDPYDGSYNQSNVVTVEINSGTPGTPLNYDRADDSCTATFTTANDGLTAKVELYRSTELDFVADASTLEQTKAVPPNTSDSITDPGPNCDDYYYAIRAVSAAGAGSGFVGDEKVTVRHRTRTRTITVRPAAAGGAIPVGGGTVTPPSEGAVGGAETEQGAGEGGEVLGEEGAKSLMTPEGFWEFLKNNRWYFLGALVLLAFIYYGYRRKPKTTGSEG